MIIQSWNLKQKKRRRKQNLKWRKMILQTNQYDTRIYYCSLITIWWLPGHQMVGHNCGYCAKVKVTLFSWYFWNGSDKDIMMLVHTQIREALVHAVHTLRLGDTVPADIYQIIHRYTWTEDHWGDLDPQQQQVAMRTSVRSLESPQWTAAQDAMKMMGSVFRTPQNIEFQATWKVRVGAGTHRF